MMDPAMEERKQCLKEKLERLAHDCAEQDWDGYNGAPLTSALIRKAKNRIVNVLKRFSAAEIPASAVEVTPVPRPSIQFESEYQTAQDEGMYMEIEIEPDKE